VTRKDNLLKQFEEIEDADDAQEILQEAWKDARKEALDYEHAIFAIKDMDDFELDSIKKMLEDNSYLEVNHK